MPAWHCGRAVLALRWDEQALHWVLRRRGVEVARTPGYPTGRGPVHAAAARDWADSILGARQDWIEKPTRSGAYHTH